MGVNNTYLRVPVMAQPKQIWLVSLKTRVWYLALLCGLRIWCCCGCGAGSSCSSDSTPSLGTPTCHRWSPKKQNKNKTPHILYICTHIYIHMYKQTRLWKHWKVKLITFNSLYAPVYTSIAMFLYLYHLQLWTKLLN